MYMYVYVFICCRQGKVENHDMRDGHATVPCEVNDAFMWKDQKVSMKLISINFRISSVSSSILLHHLLLLLWFLRSLLLYTVYRRTTICSSLLYLFTCLRMSYSDGIRYSRGGDYNPPAISLVGVLKRLRLSCMLRTVLGIISPLLLCNFSFEGMGSGIWSHSFTLHSKPFKFVYRPPSVTIRFYILRRFRERNV